MSKSGSIDLEKAVLVSSGGFRKLCRDTLYITELKICTMVRSWYWILLSSLLFPIPLFFLTRSLTSDDPEILRRLLAGTLVYGAAFATGMLVGQQFAAERFMGTLKLFVTMPVSKISYVFATLAYASIIGAVTLLCILFFAIATGVEVKITVALVPLIVLTVLCLAGITLFVVSFAHSLEVANVMTGFVGMILAVISPVYFTMEQAPAIMRWLGYVSPLRYASDGITASFSGRTDIWFEFGVLLLTALVTMSLGLWKLPWREV